MCHKCGTKKIIQVPDGNPTHDLLNTGQVLYPLSYCITNEKEGKINGMIITVILWFQKISILIPQEWFVFGLNHSSSPPPWNFQLILILCLNMFGC